MSNYYEILQIQPGATAPEIETACEVQYNHWRRLVTHHDSSMVAQANQALQQLEQIRTTLTDPQKRVQYDANLGLNGNIGGLMDPQAQSIHPTILPPPRPGSTNPSLISSGNVSMRVDAWVCPTCQTPNPIGTLYCVECGTQIGVACPSCQQLIPTSAKHCPKCGVNRQEAIHSLEAQRLETQRQATQQHADSLKQQLTENVEVLQALKQTAQTGKVKTASSSIAQLVIHSLSQERPGCKVGLTQVLVFLGPLLLTALIGGIVLSLSESENIDPDLILGMIGVCWLVAIIVGIGFAGSIEKRWTRLRANRRILIHKQIVDDLQRELQNLETRH